MKKTVVVLGLGVSGLAASRYLMEKRVPFIGMDREVVLNKTQYPFPVLADTSSLPKIVAGVVRSPGISESHPIITEAREQGIPVISELELAFGDARIHNYPCIGITGSNGKTTTTEFLVHMLKRKGVPALAVGNIGSPLIENLDFQGVKVVEISSFQLVMAIDFPVLSSATILNISPNHLDYHKELESYAVAKSNIFRYMKDKKNLFVPECLVSKIPDWGGQYLCSYFEKFRGLWDKEDALKGICSHDRENYCAALALSRAIVDISDDEFVDAVKTFSKPPHRLEFVANVHGVRYVNDSKATTFDSVVKGVCSVQGEVILLLGGRNKGGDFFLLVSQLLKEVRKKIKKVIAFGESRDEIFKACLGKYRVEAVPSLEEAVKLAKSEAIVGDTVLLSPGCASFDQFTSFECRGEKFKQLVHEVCGSLCL